MKSFRRVSFGTVVSALMLVALFAGGCMGTGGGPSGAIRVGRGRTAEPSRAVIVKDRALLHTAQLLPFDERGAIASPNDLARQIDQVVDNLRRVLSVGESQLEDVVKLNIYVSREDIAAQAREKFARHFATMNQPAVSWVVGRLTRKEAMVAIDAVAITSAETEVGETGLFRVEGLEAVNGAVGAILPKGGRLFVSGQAKNGTLQVATRETLENLGATLGSMGLDRMNVVQIKAFMQPISDSGIVQGEVSKFFGLELPPPIVFVEWRSSSNTPVEIELIVAEPGPPKKGSEPVEYLTPPGMTASKVFSRVTHVSRGRMIYLSSLIGDGGADAHGQLDDVFAKLGNILQESGSDFEHLVKATYYVTDEDASAKLNDIRSKFFNPKRPPAASKAMVAGVGGAGRSVAIDMIAVTK